MTTRMEPIARSIRASLRGPARLGGIAAAACLALGPSNAIAAATSSDARPPITRIVTPFGSAPGRMYAAYWTTRDGRYCVTGAGDGPLLFDFRGVPAEPGSVARIRIFKPTRPTELELDLWRRVDDAGSPVGRSRSLRVRLAPHAARGAVHAWDVSFRVPGYATDYLSLFARWPDEEGCSTIQDAAWSFELRRTTRTR